MRTVIFIVVFLLVAVGFTSESFAKKRRVSKPDGDWDVVGTDMYSNANVTGNVGIGTTNPEEKLTVAGTIESTSGGVKFPDGTVQASASGGGYVLSFGAHVGTIGALQRYLLANGDARGSAEFSGNGTSKHTVPMAGIITTVAWSSRNGDATTELSLRVNEILQQTITFTGANGVNNTLSIPVGLGDSVELEYTAGTSPSKIVMSIYIQ